MGQAEASVREEQGPAVPSGRTSQGLRAAQHRHTAVGQGRTAPEHSKQSQESAAGSINRPKQSKQRASSWVQPGERSWEATADRVRLDWRKHCNTGPETMQKSWLKGMTGDKLQHMYKRGIQETSYLQCKSKVHPKGQRKRYTYTIAKARPRSELKWSSWAPGHGPEGVGHVKAPGEAGQGH